MYALVFQNDYQKDNSDGKNVKDIFELAWNLQKNANSDKSHFINRLKTLAAVNKVRMVFHRVQAELVSMHVKHGQSVNHLYEDLMNISAAFDQDDLIIDKLEFDRLTQQDFAKYNKENDDIVLMQKLKNVEQKKGLTKDELDSLEKDGQEFLAKF